MLIFIFILKKMENNSKKMCKVLEKIKGKSPEELINSYYHKNTISIDIAELAQNIGIQLSGVDFTDMEQSELFKEKVEQRGNILGAVYVKDDTVTISYSKKLTSQNPDRISESELNDKLLHRQRFTIAHEIAHCVLDMKNSDGSHIEYRMEKDDETSEKEKNANIYAGELLMPTKSIEFLVYVFDSKLDVELLSNLFVVSKNVVKARLKYLQDNDIISTKFSVV